MKIFDGHSDLWEDVDEKRNRGLKHIIRTFHQEKWQKGNIMGGFYPIWVDPENKKPVKEQAQSILRNLCTEIKESGEELCIVKNYEEFLNAVDTGKQGMFLGAEGLSFLDEIEDLEVLYQIGFREASLTWNESNHLAAGAGTQNDYGLTAKGKRCIDKMAELNMIVDLAHASEKTFWDVMERIDGPCMISHGNCRGLCDLPRNYTDTQIKAIAERKGVIGVCAYPAFVAQSKEKQTVAALADHIDYIVNLVGIDYVGFGFDFVDFLDDAGIDPTISDSLEGFSCVEESGNLLSELRRRSYTQKDLKKICADNFLRVIQDVLL